MVRDERGRVITDDLLSLCSILSWNDSISSLKATLLMGPMIRYMCTEQILNPSLASNLMIAILQAFQVHGQHDSNVVSVEEVIFLF